MLNLGRLHLCLYDWQLAAKTLRSAAGNWLLEPCVVTDRLLPPKLLYADGTDSYFQLVNSTFSCACEKTVTKLH